MQENVLGRKANILLHQIRSPDLATPPGTLPQEWVHALVRFSHMAVVTLRFIGTAPTRDGFGRLDGWFIDNAESYQQCVRALRPADAKFHGGCAVGSTM